MSDGKLRPGQEYRPQDDVVAPFVQQIVDDASRDTVLGTNRIDIEPMQEDSNRKKAWDVDATRTNIKSVVLVLPTTISFELPPLLTGFTVTVDTNTGDGNTSVSGDGIAVGTSVSVSLSPRVEGSGSGTIMPDVQPEFQNVWTQNLYAQEVLCFVDEASSLESLLAVITPSIFPNATDVTVSIASPGVVSWNSHGLSNGDTVLLSTTGSLPTGLSTSRVYYVVNKTANTFQLSLSKGGAAINTSGSQSGTQSARAAVRPWPVFFPVAHTITVVGQSASLQTNASLQQQVAISGSDTSVVHSEGTGISRQVGTTVKTIRIPPTLHGALTLSVSPSTATINSRAQAAWTNSSNWPAQSADTGAQTLDISASVSPNIFTATTPAGYPSSGMYLQSIDGSSYDYGLVKIRAVVFDFATIYGS